MSKFTDIFDDVTKLGTKIPTDKYLLTGKYPIIDQGQKLISGYIDNSEGIYSDVPALIFGDHTRIVKYIDMPFFLGADGVKLLKSKSNSNDYKYLYYALCNVNIPNTGYNRHFKWLKESEILLPPLDIQCQIASTLDKVTHTIDLCNSILEKLDLLVKSRFVEMFGEPVSNSMRWKCCEIGKLATKIGSGATPKGGRESYGLEGISLIRSMNVHNGYFEYKDLAHISDEQAEKLDNVTIYENDVLLNITGASVARCCIAPSDVLPARVNQHVCIIRCKPDILPIFMCSVLTDDNYQKHLWDLAGSGATREAITKQQIENLSIIVPPIEIQSQFVAFVEQTTKSKSTVKKVLEKAELLKKSLMQQYFG